MKEDSGSADGRAPTVFVVDDDAGVRDALRLLLYAEGLTARAYSSGRAFLDDYRPDQPGCLVLDLRMPGMSGVEVQKRLQNMGASIPIVFITAQSDLATAVDAIKAGAVAFLQKPFSHEKLLERVREALGEDAQRRAGRARREDVRRRLDILTPEEGRVMALLLMGEEEDAMAEQLEVDLAVVRDQRSSMMRKMHAGSVAELAELVMNTGEEA